MLWRTLRAFAWMRWRVLLNSLERTSARDTLERLSLAVEHLGPLIALALFVPSAIGLAGLAGYSGYWLAEGQPVMTFEALRLLLLATCAFAVVGPLFMPSMEPTAIVRLLLLPIPRGTLYAAQTAGAMSETWTIIALPIVLTLPLGLLAGGAWEAAAVASIAGLLVIVCIVGLSTLATLLLHLVVRNRRRGELAALLFIILIPVISLIPALMAQRSGELRGEEHERHDTVSMPAWVTETAAVAYAAVPSELFTRAIQSAVRHERRAAFIPVVVLAGTGIFLHALGLLTFVRLLDSPSAGTRRAGASRASPGTLWLPFLSRASAAVAQGQLRLAFRTPRGQSVLLSPFVIYLLMAVVMRRQGEMTLGIINLASGIGLATFGGALSLIATLPLAMNQFAIDRAGLTMALLSPLSTRELLVGKAVGLGLIAGGPATVCTLIAYALVPSGPPALWLSLLPALVATYLLFAPFAATLSAMFPRAVDLNSIGRGSNPHGLANFLGLVGVIAAGLPAVLIVVVTSTLAHRPGLAPILMVAWCGIAFFVCRVLMDGVARLFERRRENLGLVAS